MSTPVSIYGFSFNNFLFGGTGQGVQVLSITGMDDLPDVRVQDDNRGYQDGMFTGRDFLSGRTIVMKLQIMSANGVSMFTYLNQLKAALTIQQYGTQKLQFLMPGYTNSTNPDGIRYINARVRHRKIMIDPNYTYGRAEADVEFFCPDPRYYDYQNTNAPYVLSPVNTTGRIYPRVYPLVYNTAIGSTNSVTLSNFGNTTTYPTFTISGPVSQPGIYNSTTGQYLTFNASLGSGEQLVIDTDLRTVYLKNSPTASPINARNLLKNGSQWFGLPPVTDASVPTPTTTIYFSSITYSAGASLSIDYRNAYI